MPSLSLQKWRSERSQALDEIEQAHQSVGGKGPGRRYATQHINQAYAVLLSSHFQGFCRDLHDECADHFVQPIAPVSVREACRSALIFNRKLDSGNPNPGNLGSDFGRFNLDLWDEVKKLDVRNKNRQKSLEELNRWRNAIAHQVDDPKLPNPSALTLLQVQRWRAVCDRIGTGLDRVMRDHLGSILGGRSPW